MHVPIGIDGITALFQMILKRLAGFHTIGWGSFRKPQERIMKIRGDAPLSRHYLNRHGHCTSEQSGTQSSSGWSNGWLLMMQSQGELEGRYHGQRCQRCQR